MAEVREGQNFKDSDIERAVRVALLDGSMKEASVSSTNQGGGKRRSDTPTVSQEALASHPFTAFLRRIAGLVHLRGLPRSFNLINSVNSRCGKSCGMLRRHFELGQRHVREREEYIARQREIVARLSTCGNQLRFKWHAIYCGKWNMHRCCMSPSATDCASSSD